jgi:hypothetical protein
MEVAKNNIFVNLHQVLKQKRGDIKNSDEDFNYHKVANSSENTGYLNGKKIKRVIFYLRSKGCEWSCTNGGGCFMCGHYFGTSKGKELPEHSLVNQFKAEYEKYNFENIPVICIYNAGSILNDNEIRNEQLFEILGIISKNPNIKRIVLESRPEFIEYELLSKISEICSNQTIEIGIGLETSNDFIRSRCINKGFTFEKYIQAVCRIKKFSNLKVLTYLTVKPIFLTIEEAKQDVINSIIQVCEFTDIISLEPVSVQKNTLIEYLYQRNLYSIPKGWLIKDIVKELKKIEVLDKFELRIGGFEFFPAPELVINNCDKCNKRLYDAINYYNSTNKIDKLMELDCECRKEYDEEVLRNLSVEPLEERISNIMNEILKEVIE